MQFTVQQIAHLLNGEVEGNPDAKIWQFSKIEEGSEGSISFLSNPKYEPFIYKARSTAIIVSNDFQPKAPLQVTLIRVAEPYVAIGKLMAEYQRAIRHKKEGIDSCSKLEEGVKFGDGVYVGAFVYVDQNTQIGDGSQIYPHVYLGKNVKIGSNSVIYSGVKIYDNSQIGNNCILHSGAVIGADGFGFAPDEDRIYHDIPQLGNVVIEENVSIGANTTIDRATMGSTLIGKGSKIDNLVQIGHNVVIGQNTVIAGQTGIAGSTKIGNYCQIGGQVGFAGHISIADGTKIGAQSGINKSIETPNLSLAGRPQLPLQNYLKLMVQLRRLSDMSK